MKHLTKHESQAALDAIKAQLAKPQVAIIADNNGVISGSIYYEKYVANVTPVTPSHDYSQDYFTLEAIDNCTFSFSCPSGGIQYSTDNGSTWSEEYGETQVSVSAGDKVLLKGNMTLGERDNYSTKFNTANGRYNVEGNIFSLHYGDNFTGITDINGYNSCFCLFFADDTYLVNAEHLSLPATTLADYCYQSMFSGCTSLTTAPELPATTLASSCYSSMFSNCISLTTAPELPATTLASYCYEHMFSGCTSLTTAPELPATTLVERCYSSMFYGCTSLNYVKCLATNASLSSNTSTSDWLSDVSATGTFVKNANATNWNIGPSYGIPSGWTVQDAA